MIERRYTLKQAVETFFPGARLSKRGLSAAVRGGKLRAEMVCGQYLVTESAIADYLKACTHVPAPKEKPCPDQESHRGSTSAKAGAASNPDGSSSMDRVRLARARAQKTLQQLSAS